MKVVTGALARFAASRIFWALIVLAALVVINVIAFPGFVSISVRDGHLVGSIIDILRNGSPTLLIAIGMTLVIATRGIDLSVGAVCAISGAVASAIILGSSEPDSPAVVAVAVITALVLAVVLGLWNGLLVTVIGIQPIVATLILMTAGRGIAMLITEGQILTVSSSPFKSIGTGYVFGIPVPVIIAALVLLAAILITRRTALGMMIESVGINPEASRQAGVRARALTLGVYTVTAVLAALAGLILTSNQTAADANNTGLFIELDAILAVVIGGTSLAGGRFSLTGTLIGALFIATLARTIPNIGIPSEINYLFKAVVVIAVCLLQSPKARAVFRSRRGGPTVPTGPAAPVPAKAGSAA
jgi:ribose/xylose/arabinose/galactoside ABC-type transport system permease subunit